MIRCAIQIHPDIVGWFDFRWPERRGLRLWEGLTPFSRALLSFSPLHRKNDQINYRGAKLITRQTIASPTPVHVKISSPISKKNLSRNQTQFPKNPSRLSDILERRLPLSRLERCPACHPEHSEGSGSPDAEILLRSG